MNFDISIDYWKIGAVKCIKDNLEEIENCLDDTLPRKKSDYSNRIRYFLTDIEPVKYCSIPARRKCILEVMEQRCSLSKDTLKVTNNAINLFEKFTLTTCPKNTV